MSGADKDISWRLGGAWNGRPLHSDDLFEATVNELFGEKLKQDSGFGVRLWSSLANVEWRKDGAIIGYSFRAAGDLIVAVIGKGHYMDWYCSGPEGTVDPEIAQMLASKGWKYSIAK